MKWFSGLFLARLPHFLSLSWMPFVLCITLQHLLLYLRLQLSYLPLYLLLFCHPQSPHLHPQQPRPHQAASSAPPTPIASRQSFDVTCNARPVQPLNGRSVYVPAIPYISSSNFGTVSSYFPNSTNVTSSSGQFAGIDKPTAASAVATLTLSMLLLAALIAVTVLMVVYQIRIARR